MSVRTRNSGTKCCYRIMKMGFCDLPCSLTVWCIQFPSLLSLLKREKKNFFCNIYKKFWWDCFVDQYFFKWPYLSADLGDKGFFNSPCRLNLRIWCQMKRYPLGDIFCIKYSLRLELHWCWKYIVCFGHSWGFKGYTVCAYWKIFILSYLHEVWCC